jgi:hypothetical protein
MIMNEVLAKLGQKILIKGIMIQKLFMRIKKNFMRSPYYPFIDMSFIMCVCVCVCVCINIHMCHH